MKAMAPVAQLHAEDIRLNRPVVVYDGECPFCLKHVDRMQRCDRGKTFEYQPRQASGLEDRFPRLAEGDFNSGMRLIDPDGSISVGADAIYNIARQLDGWKYLAWLYRVPGFNAVCRACYAWIARNRYRLAEKCEDGVCEME
jgi:predicted DCC family thiol-disulfide oxidoreductase YuxK